MTIVSSAAWQRALGIFCFATVALGLATAGSAKELNTVKVGVLGVASDAPLYLAAERGYFAQQGIKVKFVHFTSATFMVAPMSRGELDVGAGGLSAGLFNAVERKIHITAVADKVHLPLGSHYLDLIVRQDIVASGHYRREKDIKGLRIAEAGFKTVTSYALAMLAKAGDLTYDSFNHLSLPFPEQLTALKNKSIDGAVSTEPFLTEEISTGLGTIVTPLAKNTPNLQIAVVLYSQQFAANKDLAQRFMNAYIEGARFYNGALKDDHLVGPNAQAVIPIMIKHMRLKNAAVYRRISAPEVDPNGKMNLDSMRDMLRFFQMRHWVGKDARVSELVNTSFIKNAEVKLGLYKRVSK